MKILRIFIFLIFLSSTVSMFAQTPPPPPSGHGDAGNAPAGESGGGAPIGDGVGFLLALGFAYGVKKFRTNRRFATTTHE